MYNLKQDYPSQSDFEAAAWLLKCEVESIMAVAEVESGPQGVFLENEEGNPPVILYERHYFSRLTDRKFDGKRWVDPNTKKVYLLSSKVGGGYGPYSIQHDKLQAAVKLNRNAALMSCSWGLFQIMGSNYEQAGYQDVQRFVTAMYRSVQDHLRAFTVFIRQEKRTAVVDGRRWTLIDALRENQFLPFALIYNGSRQKGYNIKISESYYRLRRAKK